MSDQIFISSIGSSLFDTYLVYGIIGLLLAIAFVGVIVLLATACCCSNCYSSARAFCCLNCYRHSLRHSTYRLSQESNHQKRVVQRDKTKLACIKRNTSDVANFSQLYESCPHLINNKAMTTKPQNTNSNMESSCTTIDTIISPISPCSSFRSFATPIPSATPIKISETSQNDINHLLQPSNLLVEKQVPLALHASKAGNSRPFSYIKNTTDRAQILRRFTPQERTTTSSKPVPAVVPLEIQRVPSTDTDSEQQSQSASTNIYETVVPSSSFAFRRDMTVPIYETEWTHSIKQLMMENEQNKESPSVSVIELSTSPPDLVPSTSRSINYFQQQSPHEDFLVQRAATSDSLRRKNMLRGLNDDAAFLY